MNVATIERLFAYDLWANERIFTAVEALPDEERRRDMGNSFPSILDTLEHVVGAEWIWLQRWQGTNPTGPPDWYGGPELGALRDVLREIESERATYLAGLTDDDLGATLHYRLMNGEERQGPLGFLLAHVVNHSTHHRGQVVTMMRQLGHTPPMTDLLWFL